MEYPKNTYSDEEDGHLERVMPSTVSNVSALIKKFALPVQSQSQPISDTDPHVAKLLKEQQQWKNRKKEMRKAEQTLLKLSIQHNNSSVTNDSNNNEPTTPDIAPLRNQSHSLVDGVTSSKIQPEKSYSNTQNVWNVNKPPVNSRIVSNPSSSAFPSLHEHPNPKQLKPPSTTNTTLKAALPYANLAKKFQQSSVSVTGKLKNVSHRWHVSQPISTIPSVVLADDEWGSNNTSSMDVPIATQDAARRVEFSSYTFDVNKKDEHGYLAVPENNSNLTKDLADVKKQNTRNLRKRGKKSAKSYNSANVNGNANIGVTRIPSIDTKQSHIPESSTVSTSKKNAQPTTKKNTLTEPDSFRQAKQPHKNLSLADLKSSTMNSSVITSKFVSLNLQTENFDCWADDVDESDTQSEPEKLVTTTPAGKSKFLHVTPRKITVQTEFASVELPDDEWQ